MGYSKMFLLQRKTLKHSNRRKSRSSNERRRSRSLNERRRRRRTTFQETPSTMVYVEIKEENIKTRTKRTKRSKRTKRTKRTK